MQIHFLWITDELSVTHGDSRVNQISMRERGQEGSEPRARSIVRGWDDGGREKSGAWKAGLGRCCVGGRARALAACAAE